MRNIDDIERVAILGVGLIGGSLGLSLKERTSGIRVAGFDDRATLERALDREAIDDQAESVAAAVRGAQVVFLATPLRTILELLGEVAAHVEPGCIVTDVASVKGVVMQHAASVLPEHATFVGGHPMTGSEQSGIEAADAYLFENATYVVSPPDGYGEKDFLSEFGGFAELVQATGARVLLMGADRHDDIAAAVSHLPQLLAVALANYVGNKNVRDSAYLQLAAGGFRDMTRIASSPFGIWEDIFLANHGGILDSLAGFSAELQRLRNRVIEEDLVALESAFREARVTRDTIPSTRKGFLQPVADVYVGIDDRPGALFEITKLIFEADLSIKDIELLKLREGTGGTFRIAFDSDAEADRATDVLNGSGVRARRLEQTG